jgi:hypothetical protein
LLRPLAVVNPHAEALTFASDRVRLRRDHVKYLALIDAIALLHQHQREVRTVEVDGATVEYIEATPADIALANRLAHAVLGRSLDELPPQTRRVLVALDGWVSAQATAAGMERAAVRFTRRSVRGPLGLSDTQLRVHLERLVQLEYVRLHSGQNGSLYTYSLMFDGNAHSDAPQLVGLVPEIGIEPATSRGQATTLRGSAADPADPLRPAGGAPAAATRRAGAAKSALKPAAKAALPPGRAVNARSRRVNGHAAVEH